MLDLYLKKVTHNLGFDVMAYKDSECIRPVAHWTYDQIARPDKRFKTVMLNCHRWNIVWLN